MLLWPVVQLSFQVYARSSNAVNRSRSVMISCAVVGVADENIV